MLVEVGHRQRAVPHEPTRDGAGGDLAERHRAALELLRAHGAVLELPGADAVRRERSDGRDARAGQGDEQGDQCHTHCRTWFANAYHASHPLSASSGSGPMSAGRRAEVRGAQAAGEGAVRPVPLPWFSWLPSSRKSSRRRSAARVPELGPVPEPKGRPKGRTLLGYIVWGSLGAVIAIIELLAAIDSDSTPWPTLSSTVGGLQRDHSWVGIFVLGGHRRDRRPHPLLPVALQGARRSERSKTSATSSGERSLRSSSPPSSRPGSGRTGCGCRPSPPPPPTSRHASRGRRRSSSPGWPCWPCTSSSTPGPTCRRAELRQPRRAASSATATLGRSSGRRRSSSSTTSSSSSPSRRCRICCSTTFRGRAPARRRSSCSSSGGPGTTRRG